MKMLETERLLLRGWLESDAEAMYDYAKSQNVGPKAGWKPHESVNESLEKVKAFIEKDEVWAIVIKSENKVIGSIGLQMDVLRTHKRSKMIGYVLHEHYWGKGITAEAVKKVLDYAFCELDLLIVSIGHFPFNQQSKRVIEKCGFTYEGTMRLSFESYNGDIYDEAWYSITREEWESTH